MAREFCATGGAPQVIVARASTELKRAGFFGHRGPKMTLGEQKAARKMMS